MNRRLLVSIILLEFFTVTSVGFARKQIAKNEIMDEMLVIETEAQLLTVIGKLKPKDDKALLLIKSDLVTDVQKTVKRPAVSRSLQIGQFLLRMVGNIAFYGVLGAAGGSIYALATKSDFTTGLLQGTKYGAIGGGVYFLVSRGIMASIGLGKKLFSAPGYGGEKAIKVYKKVTSK